MHISRTRAWSILRENIKPLPDEECKTIISAGRILAEDVASKRNVPHYNASAMDGYSLTASSTAGASPSSPVIIEQGGFSWVNTGDALPACFDSVLMSEDASLLEGEMLSVVKSLVSGENVRPVGEDVFRGQLIARSGETITPATASLLAIAGVPRVKVHSLPRSLYVPTGDEIIPTEEWLSMTSPPAGRIGESNSIIVEGYFKSWGLPVDVSPCLPDDRVLLSSFLEEKTKEYDLVLVGAGSAKGERDHTFSILEEMGRPLFRWLLMKPGRPASAAILSDSVVVNLPGFPMSNAVVLWSLVYPVLQLLMNGDFDDESVIREALGTERGETVSLLSPYSSIPGREDWLRLKCVEIDGERKAFPLPSGASSIWSLAEVDAVALLGLESAEIPKGAPVSAWMTRSVPWDRRVLFQGSNDPAMERLPTFVRRSGGDLVLRSVGSLAGLAALSRRECHVAAAHLLHAESGVYNTPFIDGLFPDDSVRVARRTVFFREQGFIVGKGNPKKVRGVEDLARDDIAIINRQRGAGTRVLLDAMMAGAGIGPESIRGYDNLSPTHFESANRVALGFADVALGIKAVADALDLDFIPVAEEPYELVYLMDFEDHTGIRSLLEAMDLPEWRAVVDKMGGYRWA
ncbi:MAG: molybdopterin biosynthesis protein MoeA [Synergistaceae bacterium]|nr:molybdopterin biosynthesis protein MoeA [Synergistaceae bacterium]